MTGFCGNSYTIVVIISEERVMKIVILGAPGAGKGTQAANLSVKLKIPHISTGDIFRSNIKAGTPLGKTVKQIIDNGGLVPDEITIEIVKGRLSQEDCRDGFILDGFPRTIPQAEGLELILDQMGAKLDYVLNIVVTDAAIIRRLSGRRICPDCNTGYHIDHDPPMEEGICDNCGARLIQREDDSEDTIISRLNTYHDQTEPLIGFYEERGLLANVTGQYRIEDTTNEVYKVMGIKE